MLGPSVIRLHGVFFRHLWFFKDNYFGYDDKYTPLAVPYNRAYDKNKTARVRRPAAPVSKLIIDNFYTLANLINIFSINLGWIGLKLLFVLISFLSTIWI